MKDITKEELEAILTKALVQGKLVGQIKKWSMEKPPPDTGFDDFSLWNDIFLDDEDDGPFPPYIDPDIDLK